MMWPRARVRPSGWREHLRGGGLDEAEDAGEIDAERGGPLRGRHGGDGLVVRRPDAVVDDEDVEAAEDGGGGGDEGVAVVDGREFLLDGAAVVFAAALFDESARAGLRRSDS